MEAVIRSVKRACYSGLDSVSLRREIAERMAPVVRFDAHAFSTCDPDTGIVAHTVAHGIPGGLARDYVERIYPQACAGIAVDMARKGCLLFSEFDACPLLRVAAEEYGLHLEFHASLADRGRLWGTWCMMWATASPRPSERARLILEQLAPHVVHGLREALLVDQALARPVHATGDGTPGVLVLDAANRPMVRTPQVGAYLEDLADVGLRMSDDLPLSVHALTARLRRARVEVATEARARVRGLSGRWYVLRASLAEPDAAGLCPAVVVIRPAVQREVATILTRLYDLSAREREIVAAVARGESTKEIAAALGLSPHTVVEHVERACRKIGVRGRKALIAKLFVDGHAPGLAPEPPAMLAS